MYTIHILHAFLYFVHAKNEVEIKTKEAWETKTIAENTEGMVYKEGKDSIGKSVTLGN